MASSSRLLPPRISAPDLPPELSAGSLASHADAHAADIVGLRGSVDASHARVTECRLSDVDVEKLELSGSSFTDVDIDDPRAVVMTAREARWQTVRIVRGRVATLDLSRSELSVVELRGTRIDYLSLAGATVDDLLLVDCTIGALDAPQARLSRVKFEGCRVDEVDNRGWRVDNVDLCGLEALRYLDIAALRGVTLTERQVTSLARDFAAAMGIHVAE